MIENDCMPTPCSSMNSIPCKQCFVYPLPSKTVEHKKHLLVWESQLKFSKQPFHGKFAKHQMETRVCFKDVQGLNWSSFGFVLCTIAPATRNHHHAPNQKMKTISQNETLGPFKTSLKVTKHSTCHDKWPPKPPLISTHACPTFEPPARNTTPATRTKTCRKSCARHAKTQFQTSKLQNVPNNSRLPQKTHIVRKTRTVHWWK